MWPSNDANTRRCIELRALTGSCPARRRRSDRRSRTSDEDLEGTIRIQIIEVLRTIIRQIRDAGPLTAPPRETHRSLGSRETAVLRHPNGMPESSRWLESSGAGRKPPDAVTLSRCTLKGCQAKELE
jgi:hypothetical protein